MTVLSTNHIDTDPADLWLQFIAGDFNAFATLYNNHIESLIRYGMKIKPDTEAVKDAIQDLFVELWNAKENLQPVKVVNIYLLKALRYKLIKKEKGKFTPFIDDADILSALPPEQPVEFFILEREDQAHQQEKIRTAIKQLPKRQQEAINLRFYNGLTNEQVAEIMAINYQSATNLLHKAILSLRQWLQVLFF